MASKPTLSYAEAYEELQNIVKAMEEGAPDVDELGKMVKRAAELLTLCKKKLAQTEQDLNQTLEELE